MKVNEEKSLKGNIEEIRKYLNNHAKAGSFYDDINSLKLDSLQDISFSKDIEFFNELNFVSSVIVSIISHPHLTNKGEDIIVKAGQSGALKDDSFQRTIKDARLWKRRHNEMIVEEVYNYMNVDELKIYENIFIVMVIRLIDNQISKYDEFYNSLVSVVTSDNTSLSNDKVEEAFDKLNLLKNKIRKIKETYFFKEVSKNFKPISKVQPTNILLKDRLYNLCFKFYKKMTTYSKDQEERNDFKSYYFVLLLKALKKNGFKLYPSLKEKEIDEKIFNAELDFAKVPFHIGIRYEEEKDFFRLLVANTDFSKKANKHLLIIENQNNYYTLNKIASDDSVSKYETLESISLWNIAYYIEDLTLRFKNRVSEEKMMEEYINEKLLVIEGSHKIYSKYCPICKAKNIDVEENECTCLSCSSRFNIYKKDDKEYLFFKKVRRI